MSTKLLQCILAVSLFWVPAVWSAEYSRLVEIKTLHPIAERRPVNPGMQNSMRIYFKTGAGWSDVGCRNDAADLRAVDQHMISIVLIAWTLNKPITVHVDNTLKPDGEVCQITALTAN